MAVFQRENVAGWNLYPFSQPEVCVSLTVYVSVGVLMLLLGVLLKCVLLNAG